MVETLTTSPIQFTDSVEVPSDGEAEAIQSLKGTFESILDTTSKDYGRAVRGVHAKGHGLLRGRLVVRDDLPPELAQGLFGTGGTYEAVLRISTAPGDILDDAVSAPRGVGLKVFGVEGERLPGAEDNTQDFLMVNGPVFGAKTPKVFAKNLKLLAATTDKAEGLKKAWSATLRTLEGAIEAFGGSSVLISSLGGAPESHPLGNTYYSQAAFRYGDHIAKFALVPVSQGFTEVTGDIVSTHNRPDALREVVNEIMDEQGGRWEFRVQLCTDLEAMPVEDPTVRWDEEASPFRTVATFEVGPQPAWEYGSSDSIEDKLAFSPWHGLAAHRPLGAINRARKETYDFSADYRGEFNGCPMHAARSLEDVKL